MRYAAYCYVACTVGHFRFALTLFGCHLDAPCYCFHRKQTRQVPKQTAAEPDGQQKGRVAVGSRNGLPPRLPAFVLRKEAWLPAPLRQGLSLLPLGPVIPSCCVACRIHGSLLLFSFCQTQPVVNCIFMAQGVRCGSCACAHCICRVRSTVFLPRRKPTVH